MRDDVSKAIATTSYSMYAIPFLSMSFTIPTRSPLLSQTAALPRACAGLLSSARQTSNSAWRLVGTAVASTTTPPKCDSSATASTWCCSERGSNLQRSTARWVVVELCYGIGEDEIVLGMGLGMY